MAGRIRASDIEEVKQRTNIADVVGDYVALKNAGADSMKGLCPFHDERSPSFHVRPGLGYYHCFGCGESGDAISFVQNMDHLTFAESVERLAARINYVLTYEEGSVQRQDGPSKARLLAANQFAADFYVAQLVSDEAKLAREFLESRGFDAAANAKFGVGYSPNSWDALTGQLRAQGFSLDEQRASGLVSDGQRGVYDRFRGRIMWPIRDTSGQTVGFGARKLYEDDQGPKYLNTSETPVYRKSQVLYGLDLAKRAISRQKQAVIVEGYTDVMACHLAGIETAIATCGTAFGREHISVLRRVMGDDASAEVIFTFDPDEAGQKAALRAFSEEQRFSAQTYVAVGPEGLDPADLRLHRGDAAVAEMFTKRVPMFEFALRQAVSRFDLNAVEGRVSALRAAAPIVAGLKDQALRPGYTRELARMLGMDLTEVQGAVRNAGRGQASARRQGAASRAGSTPQDRSNPAPRRNPSDTDVSLLPGGAESSAEPVRPKMGLAQLPNSPAVWLERDALMAMLQQAPAIGEELLAQAVTAELTTPPLRVVRDAIAGALAHFDESSWLEHVLNLVPETHQTLARELALAPMPQRNPEMLAEYARGVVISLLDRDLQSLKSELLSRMQRIGDSADPGSRRIQEQLVALEAARRGLRSN